MRTRPLPFLLLAPALLAASCGPPFETAELPPEPAGSTAPIPAQPGVWTWVPFPEAKCADGNGTGMGVNISKENRNVLIYLQGGGACWDDLTCHGLVKTASNLLGGFDYRKFQGDGDLTAVPLLQRDTSDNPFRDASLVFVPYCTGDVHSGDRTQTYVIAGNRQVTHHWGYRNLTAFLRRLVTTFPNADRVWLTGSSAGGFGTAINLEHVKRAFWWARVDAVDDSGPLLQPNGDRWDQWNRSWNMHLPPGCTACRDRADAILEYYATAYPDSSFALLSNDKDAVISAYSGWSPLQFRERIMSMAEAFDAAPNQHYFLVDGGGHVLLKQLGKVSGGVALRDWLQQMYDDDPAWKNVGP
jgi:hypothetical protein